MADAKVSGPAIPPLSQAQMEAWKARLAESRDVSVELVEKGRRHVARYQARTLTIKPKDHTVVVPMDFASVEQKKAQLFKVPEVIAEATRPEFEGAAPLFSAVANHVLGTDGVNATEMMFEVQTDVLVQGYAVTKIGYENVVDGTRPVPTGEMQPDPSASPMPGAVLGLQPTPMVPVTVDVPNIISETYYWRRIPPGFLLVPKDFRGSNFDRAAFLAWRFEEDVPDADTSYDASKDHDLLLVAPDGSPRKTAKRCGTEVWYQAHRYDPTVKHPDVIHTFKLYDDEPIARDHRPSPFQRWALPPQPVLPGMPPAAPVEPAPVYQPGASLIGMKGFPLHVLTLRYVSDTAFPPSDVEMGAPQSEEISIGRTQLLRRRDRSLPTVLYDATRVDLSTLAKIEKNENTGFVGVPGPPQEIFLPLDKGQFGRENFAFNDQAQTDFDKAWALGTDAGLIKGSSPETATKSQQIQRSVDTRLQSERLREVEWFMAGVTKLMSLYQIFADTQDYVRVIGQDGVAKLQAWDKTQIPGSYAFTARPNSHVLLDPVQDYNQELDFFNLAGNAPEGNRMYMLQRLATKRGHDPARVLKPPPPKQTDQMKMSLSLKGEDLKNPVALDIMQKQGVEIDPKAVELMMAMIAGGMLTPLGATKDPEGSPETEHGGAMIGGGMTDPINKHQLDQTGGLPKMGVQ